MARGFVLKLIRMHPDRCGCAAGAEEIRLAGWNVDMDRRLEGTAELITIAPNEDAELLTRLQGGEEQAMAVLFDRYSRIVYSVALRVLRDPAAAEDVMQEIFMQMWRTPNSFVAAKGSLGGWLSVVARNRSIDTLRRKRPSEEIEDVSLASPFNLAEDSERNLLM